MSGTTDLARRMKTQAPPILLGSAIVILVVAMVAAGYYAFNGGWKTQGMQDATYTHEILPIVAARHGNPEPLKAENRLRQQNGQPMLALPEDKKAASQNKDDKLTEVRKRLGAQ